MLRCLATIIALSAFPAAAAGQDGPGAERQARREFYERDIGARKAEISKYRGVLDEQRRAAAISGFVDRRTMYACGVVIARDQDAIAKDYASYRASGGKKPLPTIGPVGTGNPSPFDY